MRENNWAGNYTYRASNVHRPISLEQVQEIASRAPELRVLGSGHSFTAIVDANELLSLERMPTALSIDRAAGTVSFGAALSYGELAHALEDEGMALANLASLPHICVARSRPRPTGRAMGTATSRRRSPRSSWSPPTVRSAARRASTRTSTAL